MDGLIGMSACLHGEISSHLLRAIVKRQPDQHVSTGTFFGERISSSKLWKTVSGPDKGNQGLMELVRSTDFPGLRPMTVII